MAALWRQGIKNAKNGKTPNDTNTLFLKVNNCFSYDQNGM